MIGDSATAESVQFTALIGVIQNETLCCSHVRMCGEFGRKVMLFL